MTFALPFPNIDPVIFAIGPFAVRWYALAFIAGLLLGWKYILWFATKPPYAMGSIQIEGDQSSQSAHRKNVDDFLVWITLGVVLGGRLGYVGFYNADYYLSNPLAILQVWQGGMSFHGGLIGVIIAIILFCRQRKLDYWAVGDTVACAVPIGLFFGRIANFINGELFGRVSDVPWAMVFPHGGTLPRHPSQLYEAVLEGLVLFILLYMLSKNERLRLKTGFLSGVFMIGYAAARGFVELFRQPDAHIGFLFGTFTMGQLLSVPLVLLGLYLIFRPGKTA